MLGEIDDLAKVIGIVRDLPVDGLDDGMILSTDFNNPHKVVGSQWFDCIKDASPTLLPVREYLGLRGAWQHYKFQIAFAVWLFAIGSQEISPARKHAAGNVLHVDGDAVSF